MHLSFAWLLQFSFSSRRIGESSRNRRTSSTTRRDGIIDFFFGIKPSQAKTNRRMSQILLQPDRPQDMGRFEAGRSACGTG